MLLKICHSGNRKCVITADKINLTEILLIKEVKVRFSTIKNRRICLATNMDCLAVAVISFFKLHELFPPLSNQSVKSFWNITQEGISISKTFLSDLYFLIEITENPRNVALQSTNYRMSVISTSSSWNHHR